MDNEEIREKLQSLFDNKKPPRVVILCFEFDRRERSDNWLAIISVDVHKDVEQFCTPGEFLSAKYDEWLLR